MWVCTDVYPEMVRYNLWGVGGNLVKFQFLVKFLGQIIKPVSFLGNVLILMRYHGSSDTGACVSELSHWRGERAGLLYDY